MPGDESFTTVGAKHIKFWDQSLKSNNGIFGQAGEQTSFACAAYDESGLCYTGGSNGQIYVWKGKTLQQTLKFHTGGFVGSLRYNVGKIFSGGKDGKVNVISTETLEIESTIDFGKVLIRAIDVTGITALVGLRDGSIYQVDVSKGTKKLIMESHSDGEVWGLSIPNDDLVLTSGDDNQIRAWSISQRKCIGKSTVSTEARSLKRKGASSLTSYPDSQCARAIDFCNQNGHVAVGHNDGTLSVRAGLNKLDQVISTNNNSKEWIEVVKYSPDGSKLAVGSHDNNIYIYSTDDYRLLGKCSKHNSFIVSVDWSIDGKYLRSVCGAHELLFFNANTF